jgi:membrane protein required for beta-lactamase induction
MNPFLAFIFWAIFCGLPLLFLCRSLEIWDKRQRRMFKDKSTTKEADKK